jgi:superfamily I DNA/RNA helicase
MDFLIADTFTASLARLKGDEQKAAKTTAFDLQMDPKRPGMSFHKLERALDRCFWSVRVSADLRLIVHRTDQSLLLCYVGHHDEAYRWAERRKLERHPKTGAAQFVEVRETVREVAIPRYVPSKEEHVPEAPEQTAPAPAPVSRSSAPLFAARSRDELLSYGVPEAWIDDVQGATEDSLLELAQHLPAEAAEALLDLAVGNTPALPVRTAPEVPAFEHPDARRRFRVLENREELERALEFPWEQWTVFLHPTQRAVVERDYSGPARISGSAGTGKTVVALHRAVHLAKLHPDARVLITTFSLPLAKNLQLKLRRLVGEQSPLLPRLAVRSIHHIGIELYEKAFGKARITTQAMLQTLLRTASAKAGEHRFTLRFLESEWTEVVEAWNLSTWEQYRDVPRLGRKTRLPEKQRQLLWSIFSTVRATLEERGLVTLPMLFAAVTQLLQGGESTPFDFAVVDEAQDISVPELRFLGALAGTKPNGLYFTGDLGQRIFQTPFSWKSLGVDIRGRSHTLRICYRTSHEIRRAADRLMAPQLADVDGNVETRKGTISAFHGPEPEIVRANDQADEASQVAHWFRARIAEGMQPHEIAAFVRTEAQFTRAHAAIEQADLQHTTADPGVEPATGKVFVQTMHLAKGLEFRAVAVLACDDEIVPLQERIEAVADTADLEDVYETERQLLYVACTRARDRLVIAAVEPVSEFVRDFRSVE